MFIASNRTLALPEHELHVADHGVVPTEDLIDVQVLRGASGSLQSLPFHFLSTSA